MNKRAFTLIEVLASVMLVAIALAPLMMIMPQIIQNSLKSERLCKVVFLAEGKIETIKRSVINSFSTSRDEAVTAFGAPFTSYKYTVSDNEAAGIKNIQVTVWYDDNGNNAFDAGEDSIMLYARIANRG